MLLFFLPNLKFMQAVSSKFPVPIYGGTWYLPPPILLAKLPHAAPLQQALMVHTTDMNSNHITR